MICLKQELSIGDSMITIQPNAIKKIKELMSDESSTSRLRVFVQGGGCSGFSYGFTIDDQKTDEDFEITSGELVVLVDSMSSQYLQGAEIDYVETLAVVTLVSKTQTHKAHAVAAVVSQSSSP